MGLTHKPSRNAINADCIEMLAEIASRREACTRTDAVRRADGVPVVSREGLQSNDQRFRHPNSRKSELRSHSLRTHGFDKVSLAANKIRNR